MIETILNDIQECKKIKKTDLFSSLVQKRLNQSLQSYYHDISMSVEKLSESGDMKSFNDILKK